MTATTQAPFVKNRYFSLFWMLRQQGASGDALNRIQSRLLRELYVAAFRHVPFYRERFRVHGLREDSLAGLSDIERLPIIDKLELRGTEISERTDERSRTNSLLAVRTSGSTGHPLEFLIDEEYDQFRRAQYLRAQLAAGRKLSDKVLRMSDVDPNIRGRARAIHTSFFQRLRVLREYLLFPDSEIDDQIREIARIRPNVIHAYPSCLDLIAAHASERNLPLHTPRLILTDSELLSMNQRNRIESAFHAPILDIYGTFETDNIAYQCPESGNYHVTSDCVILEILDAGRAVPDGEPGEVVCTVLHNRTSPFIRYNLRDVAAFAREDCPCGTGFPSLRIIEGRADDFAVTADGLRLSPQTLLGRFDKLNGVMEYEIHQVLPDLFEVTIVPGREFEQANIDTITTYIREVFPEARVSILTAPGLDRGQRGKLRTFRSSV